MIFSLLNQANIQKNSLTYIIFHENMTIDNFIQHKLWKIPLAVTFLENSLIHLII